MNDRSDREAEITIHLKHEGKSYKEIQATLAENGYSRSIKGLQRYWDRYVKRDGIDLPDVSYGQPKILYYDIETTDLRAGLFGECLMMGYRWGHEKKYKIIKINDFKGWKKPRTKGPTRQYDEKALDVYSRPDAAPGLRDGSSLYNDRDFLLIKEISKILNQADLLVGHYCVKFDHAFIQTRCLVHGLPPIPDTPALDTWRVARYQLSMPNNKLVTLAEVLGCDEQKSGVSKVVWRMSKGHDEQAIDALAEYCIQDVRTQYAVTQRLLPIVKSSVNLNLFTEGKQHRCLCGSWRIARDGTRLTKVNKYARYKCLDCGRWTKGRGTLLGKDVERLMK